MFRSILRNFTAFGVAYAAERFITFLFLIYAARKLGPDLFGQYVLMGTYVLVFSVTFTAGLMPVAIREIARQREHPLPVFEAALSLRLFLGVLAYAMLIAIVVSTLPASPFLELAAIAGTALVFDAFKDAFSAYHTAFERIAIPGAFQVANAVLIALSGTVLLHLDFGISALFVSNILVGLLVTGVWHFLFHRRFQRYRFRVAVDKWKHLLVMLAPVAPYQLAVRFNRLVSIMMLSLVGSPVPRERAVGHFSPAQQISYFPIGLLVGLRRVMIPPVTNKIRGGERVDEELIAAFKFAVVFAGFPVIVATSFFSREILFLVFGAKYLESARILQFLGGASALWIAAALPEGFLLSYPERRFTRFLAGAYVPLAANIFLCLVLIPGYSAAGAAFAALIARGVQLIFVLSYCQMLLKVDLRRFGRVLTALAILAVSYACCLLAAAAIGPASLRGLTVIALALSGMLLAGHSELTSLWRVVSGRKE